MSGPTQTAEWGGGDRWRPRPLISTLVRAAVALTPIAASFAWSWWASKAFPPHELGLPVWLWWIAVALIAIAVMLWTDKIARRFLPMAALLKLSLVFPDEAPSRFKRSLRRNTTRGLAQQLEHHKSHGEFKGGTTYGQYLLDLTKAISNHDRLTRGHSERVRAYSDAIAEEMGLNDNDRSKLAWAALLHDAGKLDVPGEILNKDGRPTDAEWEILQSHPDAGVAYVAPLEPWLGSWLRATNEHHLRWDGNGYPRDTCGVDISLAGRIVAVADAYDCMTSVRSYKEAMPAEDARAEIARCAGAQFDPVVTRAFLNVGLGRLRVGAGPLSWLGHTIGLEGAPIVATPIGSVPLATAAGAVTRSIVGLSTSVAALTVSDIPEPPPPPPVVAFAEAVVADDIPSTTTTSSVPTTTTTTVVVTTEVPSSTTTTPSSTTTSSSSTTSAPTTTQLLPTTTIRPTTTTTSRPSTTTTTTTTTTTRPPTTTTSTTTTTATTTSTTIPPGQPSLTNDYVTVRENDDERIKVLDNDDSGSSDFDEDTLRIVSAPTSAESFRVHNDHIHYKSKEGYAGQDRIVYEVCNFDGLCSRATLFITVIVD